MTSELLLSRALHLITLQLHGLRHPSPVPQQSSQPTAPLLASGQRTTEEGAKGSPSTDSISADYNDEESYFAAVREGNGTVTGGEATAAMKGEGAGGCGRGGWQCDGDGEVAGAEETSVCELLGRVARDHGALGLLFEDGLQVQTYSAYVRMIHCFRIVVSRHIFG